MRLRHEPGRPHFSPFFTHPSMSLTSSSLTLGSPRFADARLAELARTEGVLAAWQAASAQDAAKAALQATGDFAVGLQEASGRSFLAVDRFAIRSLCYRVVDGQLRFAARADALAQGTDGAE